MNLTSVLVAVAIAGSAMPSIAKMAIQPVIAQKRASNLGTAEMLAVTYSAKNDGASELTRVPASCELQDTANRSYTITCIQGSGRFKKIVSRSFRLEPIKNNQGSNAQREYDYERPTKFSGHQCPIHDPFGVYGYNDDNAKWVGGACMPQVAWTSNTYLDSNPDAWLYDINNIKGYGQHPDY